MVCFRGAHFEAGIIRVCARWYLTYPLSYRHIEEIMKERGIEVDHSTLPRWVLKYTPQLKWNSANVRARSVRAGAWIRPILR